MVDYEEEDRYQVDWRGTLFANVFWMWMMSFICMFIFLAFSNLETLESDTNRLLYLIVIVFATVKLVAMLRSPHIHFKRRE